MRTLQANEIECRVGHSTAKGASLLLYKDARVDMRMLDEIYGPTNWERYHEVVNGNLFCTVRVWDSEKGCWVSKQDVGTESNTEKEKGEASDSFKRACFNWGIGRELYTAPFIWVTLTDADMTGGKITVYDSTIVKNMGEYIANANIDDEYYLNFADAHPKLNQPGKMIMRYGKKCGSEELYSFGKMAEARNPINRYYFFG